jgi:hypothetical protein
MLQRHVAQTHIEMAAMFVTKIWGWCREGKGAVNYWVKGEEGFPSMFNSFFGYRGVSIM